MENYAAIKALLAASVEPGGSAVIGVDDRYTRAAADRIERAGKTVVRVSVVAPLRDGYYAEGSRIMRSVAGKAHPVAQLAGIGSLRGLHNAQNAGGAVAACVALGLDLPAIQKGLVSFPRPRAPHAAGRPQADQFGQRAVRQRLESHQCRQRGQALASFGDIFWIAGGKPKTGGITSLAEFFPRIRKAYLIGEAARTSPRRSTARCPMRSPACCRRRSSRRRARRRGVGPEGAGGAAVAGLRLVRPVPELRGARQSVHRSGAGDSGVVTPLPA